MFVIFLLIIIIIGGGESFLLYLLLPLFPDFLGGGGRKARLAVSLKSAQKVCPGGQTNGHMARHCGGGLAGAEPCAGESVNVLGEGALTRESNPPPGRVSVTVGKLVRETPANVSQPLKG